MIFILCVGLFTSRIILNTLGVEDYGIYNVVGGFVTIFAFLNGSMSTATQRFITFELARGELNRQRATFSTAIIIHLSLAAIIFILAETIGLWFVYNELVIPENRFYAAVWVYQFSIASCCLSVISLPYNAMIIAHERMSAFAYISIFDTILKLLIVYSLLIVPWDKLIVYSALLFTVQLLDRIIYGIYCRRHFAEAQFNWTFNKSIFKEKGIGAVSGVALKLLFMDAHLKVQDKCEVFDDYLQRRLSVIQAFLAQMNAKDKAFVDACGSLVIEPEIVPFMIEDEAANVNLLLSATGQKAICSRKTAVQQLGWVNDTDAEIEQIETEESAASYSSIYEPTV